MWELDYKESWALKNWCFWTVVLEKTLEGPLDHKDIQPVHPKGNQSRIFIGRTDAEAETPILWSPDVKNWHIWKDPDAGKDGRWEEKGTREDEMVGWHHWLNRLEFESTLGAGDGQEGLVRCIPWGVKELDTTERLNWTVGEPTGFLLLYTLHIPSCLRALACTETFSLEHILPFCLDTSYSFILLPLEVLGNFPVIYSCGILCFWFIACCLVAKSCLTLFQTHEL